MTGFLKPARVLVTFGTRPEAIKMAPVVSALRRCSGIDVRVCVTGQHREMLDQVLEVFEIRPDVDLDVMRRSQDLASLTAEVLTRFGAVVDEWRPDWVLVHGDTTTAFAVALAAFYKGIRVGHVEAGLRSDNLLSPWPEEMNRRFVDMVSDIAWAPTARASARLLAEGKQPHDVVVTGNTVIDALLFACDRLQNDARIRATMSDRFGFLRSDRRLILVTGHRRESFSGGLSNLCTALAGLADRGDVEIVWPVHLNPLVRDIVERSLHGRDSIHLIEPQDYLSFVELMRRSYLVVTDSGGIQEEAPALDKPVLIAREVTERPEVVECGAAVLCGTSSESIRAEAERLLDDPAAYEGMAKAANPFGDGQASARIAESMVARLADG